jgi:hypothetical protein
MFINLYLFKLINITPIIYLFIYLIIFKKHGQLNFNLIVSLRNFEFENFKKLQKKFL